MEEDEVHLSALDEVVGEVVGGENEPENCVLGTEEPSLQSTALSALDEVVGEVVGGENEPEISVLGTEEPSLQSTALSRLASIDFDLRPDDIDEERVLSFFDDGCGFSKWEGKNCIEQFSPAHVSDVQLQLTHGELDMLNFGHLLAHADNSEKTTAEQRHPPRKRSRMYLSYYHHGKPICMKTFLFMHTVGIKRLKNVSKSFQDNGILPRVHGNTQHLPWNASTCSEDIHIVSYKTFCHLWRTLLPSIIIMYPMSDLCWLCQQNSTIILRSANGPESEKSETFKKAMEHLNVVTAERSFYQSISDECRLSIQTHFIANGLLQLPSISLALATNSNKIKAHYSFDYAQMV